MQAFVIAILYHQVHGYHIYKDIWTTVCGEELQCQCEVGNVHDLYAVSIMQCGTIVGHVSWKIFNWVEG